MADGEEKGAAKNLQPTIIELTGINEKEQLQQEQIELRNKEDTNIRKYEIKNKTDLARPTDSFQILFKNMNEPAVLVDEKKRILDSNLAFSRISSYEKEELLGKKITSLLKKGQIITKNNGIKDFEASKVQIGLSSLYLFTDKNERETRFRLANELNALESNMEDIVLKIRKDGKIIYMNPNFRNLFETAKEGNNVKEYIKINKIGVKLKSAVEGNRIELSEGNMTISEGEQTRNCPINVKIIPVKDEFILIIKNQMERLDLNK